MHTDFENSVNSPLQPKNALDNFFMGGGRAEVLSRLQQAVAVGVPLLVLTGEEGSGKTMVCRMLEQRLEKECVVVYFQHTVESFEDVIRIIASKLGIVTAAITAGKGVRESTEKIAALLLEKDCHLLVIFDGAENIYLATLERIRKMVGQMTEKGVYLHVLFSGRPAFLGNYEQLTICDFKQIEEVDLRLEPLSEAETADYLKSCIGHLPGGGQKDVFRLPDGVQQYVFTEEVIGKICTIAKGNFGMVTTLAEESIATPGDNSSFMVLLDSVADEKKDEDSNPAWFQALAGSKWFRSLAPWAAGIAAVTVVLFLVFDSGGEGEREAAVQSEVTGDKKQEIVIQREKIASSQPVAEDTAAIAENADEKKVVIPVMNGSSTVESELQPEVTQPEVTQSEVARPEIVQPVTAQLESAPPEIKEPDGEGVKGTDAGNKRTEESVIVPEEKKEIVEQKVEDDPQPQEHVIVELRQSESLKKKVNILDLERKRKILAQPDMEVNKAASANADLTVDQLYARRLAAGKGWEGGAKDNKYTIQLMVLTSTNAEENLKQMLVQPNYRQHAANFYIFRKDTTPSVLFVYYGEYPTIAEARRVKKSIPAFLQKHTPYAVSIKGAVAKVKK